MSKRHRKSNLFMRNRREGGEAGTNRGCWGEMEGEEAALELWNIREKNRNELRR